MNNQQQDMPEHAGGRPRVQLDWQMFDNLCAIHCTLEEIAGWFALSEDTIERCVKRDQKLSFADYYKKRSAPGNISLRRRQYKLAEEGNVTMMIWLGKQWLGQSDKTDSRVAVTDMTAAASDARASIDAKMNDIRASLDAEDAAIMATYTTEELLQLQAIQEAATARCGRPTRPTSGRSLMERYVAAGGR